MATSHLINGKKRIFVKGAPDIVLNKATAAHIDGQIAEFDHVQWEKINLAFASEGQRVIAFAYKDIDTTTELTHEGLDANFRKPACWPPFDTRRTNRDWSHKS